MKNTPSVWEEHWGSLVKKRSFFGKFLMLYRKYLIAHGVAYYLNKYFNKHGVYAECGVGSGQTLKNIKKDKQVFYAVDFSKKALEEAKKNKLYNRFILADVRNLPFKDNSIDGIWNLGLMEHFAPEEIDSVLIEFKRVLKRGGKVVMFWPIRYAPHELVMNSVIWLINKVLKKKINFFPDEPSLLSSKKQAKKIVMRCKFHSCEVYFNIKDFFTHAVVVAEK